MTPIFPEMYLLRQLYTKKILKSSLEIGQKLGKIDKYAK